MTLGDIKGIGLKRIEKLNKAGFWSPLDLLNHFPYKYVDARADSNLDACAEGEEVVVTGRVAETPVCRYIRRGLTMIRVGLITDDGKTVACAWFNQKYLLPRLTGTITVTGKLERFKSSVSVKGPVILRERGIVPLYAPIKGLPQNVLVEALKQVFERVTVQSVIPESVRGRFGLMNHDGAYRAAHFPTDVLELEEARRTIAIERLAFELTGFRLVKMRAGGRTFRYEDRRGKLDAFVSTLPYRLTDDQNTALGEILAALHGDKPMNRMLQGDVGSGKTIVALLAMYYAFLSGGQSAMMAPTELLAAQHYKTALKVFAGTDVRIEYLSGSLNRAQRETALFNIRYGNADLIIGTHALLAEGVTFRSLSLVVTDEQHRFGVSQRGSLENKSSGADCLVMSATPIPRTLALVYYGDLEQSVLRSAPRGKAKIITRIVPARKRKDMLDYILKKAVEGEQSYLVCPRVEGEELVSAEELYKELSVTAMKPYLGLLHGQQRDEVKNDVMRDFYAGKIKILCTTSVIEVGIDVPDATTMVVFDADRYGLSQLHQLRGRVGRGTVESYCFLLSDNAAASERLSFFARTDDGFQLAEYDFRERGAGDFLGTRQHGGGFMSIETVRAAREISDALVRDEAYCERVAGGEYAEARLKTLALN